MAKQPAEGCKLELVKDSQTPSGSGRNFDHLYEEELARAQGVLGLAGEVEAVIAASMGSRAGRYTEGTVVGLACMLVQV